MNSITLTPDEYKASASIGLKRQALRVERGRSPGEYQDKGGTHDERNALGAVAEYALAKLLGPEYVRDWVENRAFSLQHHTIDADIKGDVHVRATRLKRGGLVLHPYDPPDGAFVLAVVDGATVTFPGWLPCAEGTRDEYWRHTGPGFGLRPAYVVPQEDLKPLDTLRIT